MNCREFQQDLQEFCRNELQDSRLHGKMLDHTAECRSCRDRFNQERTLLGALAALTQSMSNEAAPAHMEAELVRAFRESRSNRRTVPSQGASIWGLRLNRATLSTAAAFLILFGITLLAFRQGLQEKGTAQPDERAFAGVGESFSRQYSYESDFIDLGNYQAPDDWRGSQLLRVNLPRTSLLLFGLPMNADHADKMIPADVLVGQDGVPRAIRFVQTVEHNRTN
jgi:hypothetical protein